MIITRTPLRISFAGGGSDLPAYTESARGTCVSMTIGRYVWLFVNRKFDGRVRVSYSKTENVESTAEVMHDLVRLALLRFGFRQGIEIVSVGDLPSGSGLGSSAAFTVGLVHALARMTHDDTEPETLARVATEIERGAGRMVGLQDQYAAAYGGLRRYRFNADGSAEVSKPLLPMYGENVIGRYLLLFDSGRRRDADEILRMTQQGLLDPQRQRLAYLMAAEAEVLAERLTEGDSAELGILVADAVQASGGWKAQLTPGVSDELLALIARGSPPAYAGKVCGAGGGGFLLFVADPAHHSLLRQQLDLREVPVTTEPMGSQVVFEG